MTHGKPPRPWPLPLGAGDAGRRLARLLCAVLLFACLAPGISARLHAARSAAAASASAGALAYAQADAAAAASVPVVHAGHGAANPCAEHRGHEGSAGCAAHAANTDHADHADHGVYCGFCVLFSLLPVLPGTGAAAGAAALPRATGRPAGHRARPDVGDAVAAWLQQRQHGPPSRG